MQRGGISEKIKSCLVGFSMHQLRLLCSLSFRYVGQCVWLFMCLLGANRCTIGAIAAPCTSFNWDLLDAQKKASAGSLSEG
mmetsp:Transcript_2462/g.4343  ORF Transcript_2462/g.4343 Transcript_2462/m.4343 type:complete len:81 (+) Transcript_2462:265-507(+)